MVSYSVDSDSGLPKSSTTLRASEKLLAEKLEKEIKKAIFDVLMVDTDAQPETVVIE
jgi:hypothetical protein